MTTYAPVRIERYKQVAHFILWRCETCGALVSDVDGNPDETHDNWHRLATIFS